MAGRAIGRQEKLIERSLRIRSVHLAIAVFAAEDFVLLFES